MAVHGYTSLAGGHPTGYLDPTTHREEVGAQSWLARRMQSRQRTSTDTHPWKRGSARTIATDTCHGGWAWVKLGDSDVTEAAFGFFDKSITPEVSVKELSAVLEATRALGPMEEGSGVTFVTDNRAVFHTVQRGYTLHSTASGVVHTTCAMAPQHARCSKGAGPEPIVSRQHWGDRQHGKTLRIETRKL